MRKLIAFGVASLAIASPFVAWVFAVVLKMSIEMPFGGRFDQMTWGHKAGLVFAHWLPVIGVFRAWRCC